MHAYGGAEALDLGDFLAQLDQRLDALTRDELRRTITGYAERLPAREREAFLTVFAPGPEASAAGSLQPEADPDLLPDIDAFVEQVHDGAFRDDTEWYDEDDDRSWADDSWAGEIDQLFADAGEVFLAGDMARAAEAYSRLLGTFLAGLDTAMVSTDVGEAVARCLRALYETAPSGDRAAALYEWYERMQFLARQLTLHDISGTRREALPDLESFLPAWINVLAEHAGGMWAADRQRLLTEAALWLGGTDELARLARRTGVHQAATFLDWIDALRADDRLGDAVSAAREGLALAGLPGERAAEIADRLASATRAQGDARASLQARRLAWRAGPSRARLLAMVTAAADAGELNQSLDDEASHAVGGSDRLLAELLLVAGRVDEAAALLARAPALGWSGSGHPGKMVLPYLLVAATGLGVPAVSTILGRHFADIDAADSGSPGSAADLSARWEALEAADGQQVDEASDAARTPEVSLSALLARRLPAPVSSAQRDRWLVVALAAVEDRIDAVVSGKYRRAYARAAELAVAYAESVMLCGDAAGAMAFLAAMNAAHPRHIAFRRELDAAAGRSSLLSAAT